MSWRRINLNYIKGKYGVLAELWKDSEVDKKIYSNTYYMIIEAIESLPEEPNTVVQCAMNDFIEKELKEMDGIVERCNGGIFPREV